MPLPLGHTAIGLATFGTVNRSDACRSRIILFVYIAILANLPDLDVLFGLLVSGNGSAFHRGPTHSLIFAFVAGYGAAWFSRRWERLPNLNTGLCALLIFSHVVADLLLTSAPVSLFWPLEVNWTLGYRGWGDVIHMVLFQSIQDFIIATGAGLYLFYLRQQRNRSSLLDKIFAFGRRRINQVREFPPHV